MLGNGLIQEKTGLYVLRDMAGEILDSSRERPEQYGHPDRGGYWRDEGTHLQVIICNAFSLSMLPPGMSAGALSWFRTEDPAAYLAEHRQWGSEIRSAVGHADTARIFSGVLGMDVPAHRASIVILPEKTALLVGQYMGPRLPNGAAELPDGAEIQWLIVRLASKL